MIVDMSRRCRGDVRCVEGDANVTTSSFFEFFSENRVIGIAPYSRCRGHMVSERCNFLRILLFFFSVFCQSSVVAENPTVDTFAALSRPRIFLLEKCIDFWGCPRKRKSQYYQGFEACREGDKYIKFVMHIFSVCPRLRTKISLHPFSD